MSTICTCIFLGDVLPTHCCVHPPICSWPPAPCIYILNCLVNNTGTQHSEYTKLDYSSQNILLYLHFLCMYATVISLLSIVFHPCVFHLLNIFFKSNTISMALPLIVLFSYLYHYIEKWKSEKKNNKGMHVIEPRERRCSWRRGRPGQLQE